MPGVEDGVAFTSPNRGLAALDEPKRGAEGVALLAPNRGAAGALGSPDGVVELPAPAVLFAAGVNALEPNIPAPLVGVVEVFALADEVFPRFPKLNADVLAPLPGVVEAGLPKSEGVDEFPAPKVELPKEKVGLFSAIAAAGEPR